MFPVPGYVPPPGLGIGTAIAFRVTVGAAEAMLGSASAATASARRARQVDALRISFLSSFDDRSASIRVAPEPCRSGDIEISGSEPENSGDFFEPYPSNTTASSSKRCQRNARLRGLGNVLCPPEPSSLAGALRG